MTRDAEQQKYSEIAALVSITVGREQFRNAEPRFYTAWTLIGHWPVDGRARSTRATYGFHEDRQAKPAMLKQLGSAPTEQLSRLLTQLARRHPKATAEHPMEMGYSRKSALLANFHNTLVKVTRGRKDVARAVEAPFAQFIGKRCFSPSQQRLHVAWCDRETTCEHSQREVSLQEASIKFP